MFDRLVKAFAGAALAATLTISTAFAQSAPAAHQPQVKDQGEWDAIQAASKETDLNKKLDLLKAWQDKYPESEFKGTRQLQFVDTWSKIASRTLQTTATPESLAQGKAAAQSLLDHMNDAFVTANKPPNVADADWEKAKGQVEQQAHITLGWVAWQSAASKTAQDQKLPDLQTAETEFKKALELNGQSAQVSYWLGTVIALQKKVDRTPEALFSFARAVSVSGPGELNAEGKKTADAYLTKAWNGYHGDDDPQGLQQLKDMAAKSPLPPADINSTIKSVVVREQEKAGSEEEYLSQHPDIKLWRTVKSTLTAPDGENYFNGSMKDRQIPNQVFTAKVVSLTPETNPTEIRVSVDQVMDKENVGDAILKFAAPVKGKVDVGTNIKFGDAVPISYSKEPYVLTIDADKSKIIEGIEAPAPAKKAPAKRPVRRKR